MVLTYKIIILPVQTWQTLYACSMRCNLDLEKHRNLSKVTRKYVK